MIWRASRSPRDEMLARALEPEMHAAIVRELKAAGYRYVTLDLQGYRLGSLNEGLRLSSGQGLIPATGLTRSSPALRWASALAALFFVAHAACLPSTLEDIDSLNFALGLHEFNPAKHQPHPPGYPVFMALGKVARSIVPSDAKALAILGAIFGALAVFPLIALFRQLNALDDNVARGGGTCVWLAVILTIASPLYWFNALRPMSDIPGLAVTLAAQAALAAAYARQRLDPSRTPGAIEASGRMIVLGALLSAIAIGFRSQAAVLTLPLLALVLLQRAGRGAAGALLGSVMTFSIGVLLWRPCRSSGPPAVSAHTAPRWRPRAAKIFPASICSTAIPPPAVSRLVCCRRSCFRGRPRPSAGSCLPSRRSESWCCSGARAGPPF